MVVAIIAVLATITVFGLGFYNRKAAQSKSKIFVASVSQALDDYRSDEGSYPTTGADGGESSSTILYEELFGDADGDGETDAGLTAYLDSLDPSITGKAANVQEDGGTYLLIDGFKNPLRYRAPGEQNPGTEFDLWSVGFDGETSLSNSTDDTRDDITNWRN